MSIFNKNYMKFHEIFVDKKLKTKFFITFFTCRLIRMKRTLRTFIIGNVYWIFLTLVSSSLVKSFIISRVSLKSYAGQFIPVRRNPFVSASPTVLLWYYCSFGICPCSLMQYKLNWIVDELFLIISVLIALLVAVKTKISAETKYRVLLYKCLENILSSNLRWNPFDLKFDFN